MMNGEGIHKLTAEFKGLKIVAGDHKPYEGEYLVTPRASAETVLPTQGKVMNDDVRVKEIPYFEVSNETGGKTVYIGGESEIM